MTTAKPVTADHGPAWFALGHLAQLASITVFTTGLIVQKRLVADHGFADVVAAQFVLAALVMWTGLLAAGVRRAAIGNPLGPLAWGVMAPGLVLLFSAAGSRLTDGVSLSVVWGTLPLIVPLLGLAILKERFHWSLGAGALIGFSGMVLLTLDRQSIGEGSWEGNALVLAGVLCASISQIVGRFLNTGERSWPVLATLQVTGAAIVATAAAFADARLDLAWLLEREALAAMAYLVLVMTAFNFLAFNLALSRLRVAWVSIYVSLNPVVGTLASIALLGAAVRPGDWMGIGVIVAGVMLPHALRLRRPPRPRSAR